MESLQTAIIALLELGLVLWVMQNLDRRTPGWVGRWVIIPCTIGVAITFMVILVKLIYDYRREIAWFGQALAALLRCYPGMSLTILGAICLLFDLWCATIVYMSSREEKDGEEKLGDNIIAASALFVLPALCVVVTTIVAESWKWGCAAIIIDYVILFTLVSLASDVEESEENEDEDGEIDSLYAVDDEDYWRKYISEISDLEEDGFMAELTGSDANLSIEGESARTHSEP